MKIRLFTILVFTLSIGLLQAQNDTIYTMKTGSVSGLFKILRSDSELYYLPSIPADTILTDVEGNIYNTVKIGNQVVWMKENLRVTKYTDGTAIPMIRFDTIFKYLSTPGYCWYYNDQFTYGHTYGALYNWYAVNTGKLCPSGWHVPTDTEWETLIEFLGGRQIAGGQLKETATSHWKSPNTGATNYIGFTALPGGYLTINSSWKTIGTEGHWWSATEAAPNYAISRNMVYDDINVKNYISEKQFGNSVRCLRDIMTNIMKSDSVVGLYKVTEVDSSVFYWKPSLTTIISDIDSNIYNVIKIGKQLWMKENLRVTKYSDGTAIPLVEIDSVWKDLSTPGYCWYNNDQDAYSNTYGALYNWYVVNTSKLCPSGWHVPTYAEWDTLANYLGGHKVAGIKLKETGAIHWKIKDKRAINVFGFTALPGGSRGEKFDFMGIDGCFWSATEAEPNLARVSKLNFMGSNFFVGALFKKPKGCSVRCVKDE